jgi:3-oxoacyl-[acyl-carrier protein] reductase
MDWKGQVAIVTGGSRGIGAAICRRLAARGAAVGINYVARSKEAEALRAEIVAAGGQAALLQADVADSAAVAAMFAEAEGNLGMVSILVNNAGVSAPATLETYDASQLERMRAVNVNGVIHTVRAAMIGMKGRNYGRIVNIASNAAIGTALPGTTSRLDRHRYGATRCKRGGVHATRRQCASAPWSVGLARRRTLPPPWLSWSSRMPASSRPRC